MVFDWIRRESTLSANLSLAQAFPSSLRDEAVRGIAILPEPSHASIGTFSVRVGAESLLIPYRAYFDVSRIDTKILPMRQRQVVDAILTRDWNGFVRQKHLREIVKLNEPWVVPFVVQLAGEYVVQIVQDIEANLEKLDRAIYADFLQKNAEFLRLTEQRCISYWDCYYRDHPKERYAGFRVLRFFKECIARRI